MKHGLSNTKLYHIYTSMKARCYSSKCSNYRFYGKKGITVCDEWLISFQSFYEWALSHRYHEGLSIDRINGLKNYSPDNCRWITMKINLQNQAKNKKCPITRLRKMRLEKCMSQHELGDLIGVRGFTVCAWEHGKVHPSEEHAKKLISIFKAPSINWLLSIINDVERAEDLFPSLAGGTSLIPVENILPSNDTTDTPDMQHSA